MPSSAAICWRCIEALRPVGLLEEVSGYAGPDSHETTSTFCLWEFGSDGPLQNVIHAMKYARQPWLATQMGEVLADRLCETMDFCPTAVIPIPLHRVRLLERGYNQAHQIAVPVARAYGVECLCGALARRRHTRTQTALSSDQRLANVKDAFVVTSNHIPDQVLLIDDVITTGATIEAAAVALKSAGVRSVVAATLGISTS